MSGKFQRVRVTASGPRIDHYLRPTSEREYEGHMLCGSVLAPYKRVEGGNRSVCARCKRVAERRLET